MNNKMEIYDELSRVLTDYEEARCNELDLYDMLCKIQNCWESIITAEDR